MTTSVISNTLLDLDGVTPLVGVKVVARLRGGNQFFRASDGAEVARRKQAATNSSGVWQLTLERTGANLTPAGSFYEVEEQVPDASGGVALTNIIVGAVNANLLASQISVPPAGADVSTFLTTTIGDARYAATAALTAETAARIADVDAEEAARLAQVAGLSAIFGRLPQTTERVIYFGRGSNANDANDGLTPHSAKATFAGAKAALGGNGKIEMGYGSFPITAADALGNGATLTDIGTVLSGFGQGLSEFNISTPVTWGVKAQARQCRVEDVSVVFTGAGSATYGMGVSTPASPGSAQECSLARTLVTASSAMVAAYALGPDFPGASNIDVAHTHLDAVWCNAVPGVLTNGLLIGNGTAGNVLVTTAVGCKMTGATFGVQLAGGGVQWLGGSIQACTSADVFISKPPGDNISFVAVRGETGNRVLTSGYTGPTTAGVSLIDYVATGYAASQIIDHNVSGPLRLIGGKYTTLGGNTSFAVNTANDATPRTFIAMGVTTDSANPYPTNIPFVNRTIIGANQFVAGIPTPLPAFAALFDGPGLFSGRTSFTGGINTGGTAPVISTANGSTAMSVVGNNTAGRVSFTTQAGIGAGVSLVTLTWNAGPLGGAPRVILTPANGAAAAALGYSNATSATAFSLALQTPPAGATAMVFDYVAIQ